MVQDISFAEIKVGDKASMAKTVTEYDVYTFAGVTGDFNPVHIDAEFAKTTMFQGRIAHGMLSAGFISGCFQPLPAVFKCLRIFGCGGSASVSRHAVR